jgi:hypothetical protein
MGIDQKNEKTVSGELVFLSIPFYLQRLDSGSLVTFFCV